MRARDEHPIAKVRHERTLEAVGCTHLLSQAKGKMSDWHYRQPLVHKMGLYPTARKPVESIYVLACNNRSRTADFSMAKIVVIENSFEERPVILIL